MHFIYGKRTWLIKKYKDYSHRCQSCGSFDLSVRVYRKYFHVYFVPFAAFGGKTVMIRCNKCTEPYRSYDLQYDYDIRSRTPFYLYSIPIFFCLLVVSIIAAHIINKKTEAAYIKDPMPGDIYLLRPSNEPVYHFMKVIKVKEDSLITWRTWKDYAFYVSEPNSTDSFIHEDYWISRKDLQKMYDNGIIESVDR